MKEPLSLERNSKKKSYYCGALKKKPMKPKVFSCCVRLPGGCLSWFDVARDTFYAVYQYIVYEAGINGEIVCICEKGSVNATAR
jgi:hypothetical protein